ncbi:MAG: hypothetical protein IPH07_00170 [Deltaproteobacteria bacterium]|nr:hypothetical protein [Deltaproteobacteria bacterium]MBK8238588.1 hypothetical protein [Deltaproteobacteria bacterium]MBK8717411.1 hypothetical protein [Deltaproteobacteria bacterium]MBP7286278.1 hypothetical protein [Nannocystaceae bacterium]
MPSSDDRAAFRRTHWEGAPIEAGAPKRDLYASLSPAQRLAALAALNRRAWLAAGHATPPPLPRADWPGEVFEIGDRGRGG